MNRKQRRAGGNLTTAPSFGPISGGGLANELRSAIVCHQSGAFAEAERLYRHIISVRPDNADLRSRLGAVLMAQGKTGEAIPQLELAAKLQPDLFETHASLGQSYLAVGRIAPALEALAYALELRDTAPGRILVAQCLKLVRFTADDRRFRKLAVRALVEGWARPRDLTGVSVSLIKLDSFVDDGIVRASAVWPARLPAGELVRSIAALSQDELLGRLLERDPLTDIGLERLLTNVRHAMLAKSDETCDGQLLSFYCSLARQCYINEYVYSTNEAELEQVQVLRKSLAKALTSGDPFPILWLVVVSAYFSLQTLPNSETLLKRQWPECVNAIIIQQITEPAEEVRIASTIPILTGIEHDVSRLVREQYEESPYPRWFWTASPRQPVILNYGAPVKATDVLIAGCGTGLSAIEFALQARDARILAVDLSVASLAYAKRMAKTLGIMNVEFAQADIMKLASIEREFDLIDVSGVLHHLADPWEGWRILLSLLRRGGKMQIGLYSELARRNIVAARALIRQHGYQANPEDIRRCREHIIASEDPLSRSVVQWEDFFTTGECRDLLFHVHEHRVTLREIKSFLVENGLQFAGFILDARTRNRFAARFADPMAIIDLDCWARFEADNPGTFVAMYRFWAHKPFNSAGGTGGLKIG